MPRKNNPVPAKRSAAPYSWQRVAADEGVLVYTSGTTRTIVRAHLEAIDPEPDLYAPHNEQRLRAALVQYRTQQHPEDLATIITATCATVPESARVRIDKAVARITAALEGAYNAKANALQASYERAVNAGIEQRLAIELAAERKQLAESIERARLERSEFIQRRDGIKLAITKSEWQFALNCTHPDRAPDDRKTKFAEAFAIIMKLKHYVGADAT